MIYRHERGAWCGHCRRRVLARRQTPASHVALLHAAAVLVTCGLWLPFAAWACGGHYACGRRGGTV